MPILRFISKIVPSGLAVAWRFAGSPIRSWLSFVKATTDGNIFPAMVGPSALGITVACPPSNMAAAEFVVPKSMPNTFSPDFTLLIFLFSPVVI